MWGLLAFWCKRFQSPAALFLPSPGTCRFLRSLVLSGEDVALRTNACVLDAPGASLLLGPLGTEQDVQVHVHS